MITIFLSEIPKSDFERRHDVEPLRLTGNGMSYCVVVAKILVSTLLGWAIFIPASTVFGEATRPLECEREILNDLRAVRKGARAKSLKRSEVVKQFSRIYHRCPSPVVLLWASSTIVNPVQGTILSPDELLAELGIRTQIVSRGLTHGVGRRVLSAADATASSHRDHFQSIFAAYEGTHVYLGVHNGQFVFATNQHVIPNQERCAEDEALTNPIFGTEDLLHCKEVLYTNADIDFTLYTAKVVANDNSALLNQLRTGGLRFDFSLRTIPAGEKLVTAGWGSRFRAHLNLTIGADNWRKFMPTLDESDRCVSIAPRMRQIQDPDIAQYASDVNVWSWPIGCAASGGDSGSPVLRLSDRRVVGIIWTVGSIQLAVAGKDLFNYSEEQLWSRYTYAVPAAKIGEYLGKASDRTGIIRSILTAGQ